MSGLHSPDRLRVGVHANNLHLRLARLLAEREGDQRWAFVDYADGRATGELLAGGEIELGGTGSTPPLTAQDLGLEVVYLAASQPRPANGAILRRKDEAEVALAGLKGCRIALVEGSFHTYLLAHLAERAGLGLADFNRIDLSPVASARALRQGEVAAWIAMDPHLPVELDRGGLVAMADTRGVIPNRSLFWTHRPVLDRRPNQIAAFHKHIARIARFVEDHAEAAARQLSASGDVDEAQWLAVLRSRDWRTSAIDAAVLAEQEQEAACLVRHGILRRALGLSRFEDAAASA